MELNDWMQLYDVTVIELAKMLHTQRCTIYSWKNGRNKPSPHFMALIADVTKGKVKMEDWE